MIEIASEVSMLPESQGSETEPAVKLYFIDCRGPGRLATMKRPRAGGALPGQIAQLGARGVQTLVSLLTPHEVSRLGLEAERDLATDAGIEFITFPIDDHGLPASGVAATRFSSALAQRIKLGRTVAIHCRAGIGRSSLMAALVLTSMDSALGMDAALERISIARGLPVPDTDAQRAWLKSFQPKM